MAGNDKSGGLIDQLPIDRLKNEALGLGRALAMQGIDRLSGNGVPGGSDVAKGVGQVVSGQGALKGGASMAKGGTKAAASKVKDTVGEAVESITSGGKSGGSDTKVTNIVETIDVPVPRQVAYEEWTQFEEFPSFMKKVENVSQEEDDVVTWKAQIFWSHRTWKATIIDQVPPERIVWKSEAEKGRVDGAVTFHELAPDLTRVLVSLEYHPQGLFEKTGNLWRAQGRRVRAELKHFRRYVANNTLIHQDEVDGWTGEIHDGDVDPEPQDPSDEESTSPDTDGDESAEDSGEEARDEVGDEADEETDEDTDDEDTDDEDTDDEDSPPAKRATAKRSGGQKPTAKRSTAKKSSPKRSSARKSSAKKSEPAKKSTSKRSAPAKKSAAQKSPAKKSPAKKSTSKRSAPTRKSTGQRSTSKKSTSARKRQSAGSRR